MPKLIQTGKSLWPFSGIRGSFARSRLFRTGIGGRNKNQIGKHYAGMVYRVPINSLRHRIDRPEDTLPPSPRKIMKFSQTLHCPWMVTGTSTVLSMNGAWPLGSEVLLCLLNAQTESGLRIGNVGEVRKFSYSSVSHMPS